MVEPVADLLGVPVHRIFANRLLFDEASGAYAGFDDQEPTSRDGGKAAVLQQLFNAHGYEPIGKGLLAGPDRCAGYMMLLRVPSCCCASGGLW